MNPLAIVVVAVPVILAFCLGIVLEKLRHEPGEVKIPVLKAVIAKTTGEPRYKAPPNGMAQQMEWRNGLTVFLHKQFPLGVKALERVVLITEKAILEELEKGNHKRIIEDRKKARTI